MDRGKKTVGGRLTYWILGGKEERWRGWGVELPKPWVIKVVMATFLIIWSSICIPVVAMPFYPPTWKTVNEKNDPDKIQ